MTSKFNTKFVTYAVNHVNEDHAEAMLTILKHFCNTTDDVRSATLISYNATSMEVEANLSNQQSKRYGIDFPKPLKNAQEFRPVLIDLLKAARQE